jgi:deoxyribodipyrimidine photo-lyase
MAMGSVEESPAKKARIGGSLVVGWFRNDLRLRDNPMLEAVMQQAEAQKLPAMLVYILDPRFYDASDYGRVTNQKKPKQSATIRKDGFQCRKCNGRRARFYLNVLRDLRRGLSEIGTELHIFYGKPEEVFADLSAQYGSLEVFCLREPVSPEWTDVERYVSKSLKTSSSTLTTLWGAMSWYHEEDLPFGLKDVPKSYTSVAKSLGWKDIWTTTQQYWWAAAIREPLPAPIAWALEKAAQKPHGAWTAEVIDSDRDAMRSLGYSPEEIESTLAAPHGGSRKGKGGETAAWQRFNAFLGAEAVPEKVDPNFVCLGGEFGAAGAKFIQDGEVDPFQWKNLSTTAGWLDISKYMACGCITAREMYHTLYAKDHWALPGVCHRFMWREWHRLNAIQYQTHLFRLQGPGNQHQMSRTGTSQLATLWKTGQTGVPYIDACIRELNQTGWSAYHRRKTMACFLCHDLMVDWRLGGFHFEEVLLDYDVAMNYGNWSFCARVDKSYQTAFAASGFRDPDHQSVLKNIQTEASNDLQGAFIRQWVPELKDVPQEHLHMPWLMSPEQMKQANCTIGKEYPQPCINLPKLEKQSEGWYDQDAHGKDTKKSVRTTIAKASSAVLDTSCTIS